MLNILFIAPDAPPKNSPEAIQVRRILAELDTATSGRLVTLVANTTGTWSRNDTTLQLPLKHYDTHILALPFHKILGRLLMSRRLAWLHGRDNLFWIQWMADRVIGALPKKPDIIYSRSSPFSAALLAKKLKQKLHIPWVMHLSDPWADSPNGKVSPNDQRDELECFSLADSISLTTQGQADFYRKKYPHWANKMMVSANVMPNPEEIEGFIAANKAAEDKLNIVFAGALYGQRSPEKLIAGIDWLRTNKPEILEKLRFDFYGNAQPHCLEMLMSASDVIFYHGQVPFKQAMEAQKAADILLNIDTEIENPLCKELLTCKVTDALALKKPLFAITSDNSESMRICTEGYGFAAIASKPESIGMCLADLASKIAEIRSATPKLPPERYSAKKVAEELLVQMRLIAKK